MVVAVTTFSLAAALIVLVPGPDTLVVLRALIRGGRAGGAYLITLGVQSLRRRGTPHDETGGRGLLGTGFFGGMASDVLNPKVGVFFVTFLPAFIPAGASVGATTLLFGAIFSVETALYFAVLLAVATRLTRWMANARIRRRMDVGTGAVLIGLGARLAIEP